MGYSIAPVSYSNKRLMTAVDALLKQEGIKRDANLDYTCVVFDDDFNICATGSCFSNTLRCMAVERNHQGEGLMNMVVSHLCEVQSARGNTHLFLYTKPESAKFFMDLGFYEIARVIGKLVFMENRRNGFEGWLQSQKKSKTAREKTAAVVMNANPFTNGHRYLLERACCQADAVHVFVLSENHGPISPEVRKMLVERGTCDLKKVILHESGPYIISYATFPSYFLKDDDEVSTVHAQLDLAVFVRIANEMGIAMRFVGEQPFSHVTSLYNQVMKNALPENGIECKMIPRMQVDKQAISASVVRQAIHNGQLQKVRGMLPETTYAFFAGEQGTETVARLRECTQLIHH